MGFKNSRADDLTIKIRQEYNHQKQEEDCHQRHRIIAEKQPNMFLYISHWAAVLDKKIMVKKDDNRQVHYKKMRSSKKGNYSYDFNKGVKLQTVSVFNNNINPQLLTSLHNKSYAPDKMLQWFSSMTL